MLDYSFLHSFNNNIRTAAARQKVNEIIRSAELKAKFDIYLRGNRFRTTASMIADNTLLKLRNMIYFHYQDTGIMAYKIPDLGIEDDFSFEFVGNEEYESRVFDKFFERGRIYTSQDKSIIPTPREEARGETGLRFRTSKGETILGDPFIDEFIQDEMALGSQFLASAYEYDAHIFLQMASL
jgi:hypothetical protein